MVTLFECIENLIMQGYTITISREALHVKVQLSKERDGTVYEDESMLPLSDHFYEERVVGMIAFQKERLDSISQS